MIYGPNLFISSKNTKTSDTSAQKEKREDQTLINAFQDLIQIEPDIFEELNLDDLIPNTSIQNQKKMYLEEKILLGQNKLG